jgi:hypothetical protein
MTWPAIGWQETMQHVALWGPGLVILAGLFFLLRRPPAFIGEFLASQQQAAIAITKMAEAVEQVTQRSSKLDEILVGQQLMLHRMELLERVIDRHLGGDHGTR